MTVNVRFQGRSGHGDLPHRMSGISQQLKFLVGVSLLPIVVDLGSGGQQFRYAAERSVCDFVP